MKTRIPATLLKLALCTAACFSPAAHTSTLNHGFEDCRVATADELDEMRGGFDFNVGELRFSFSIDKVTFINGKLAAITHLNIPSRDAFLNIPALNSLGNPQGIIASLQNAAASMGSGTGNGGGSTGTASSGGSTTGAGGGSTATAGAGSGGSTTGAGGGSGTGTAGGSASSAGTGSGGSTGTASSGGSTTGAGGGSTTTAGTGSGGGTTGSAGSSSDGGSTGTSATGSGTGGGTTASAGTGNSYNPSNAVQNGPNNTFTLPDGFNLSATALNTIIQNSLDNQVIRNMTVLNATLNSQALIRAMAISSSLNQMLNSSVR